jgi:hypothetical protein
MTTPLRKIDMDAARAQLAALEAKCEALMSSGQRLLARIRPTSKYFGQGEEGGLFPVAVTSKMTMASLAGRVVSIDSTMWICS